MATPGATQALLGAFFFGILFNAASAALVLYVIGHGSTIFRDGLRLVLILFLLSSAAWALVEFLATIIEPTAGTSCQVAAVFSSVFDQLGKIFIEQYLVWATRVEGKTAGLSLVPQILLLGRFGVGMAFIGLTGNEFSPTCVPVSKVLPVAITVIIMDVVIFVILAIQALSMGSAKDSASSPRAPKRSVGMVVIGLGIWIGTSVVLLLGIKSTELVLKTTLPALGLAILVALVTVLSGTLVISRGPPPRRPDSPMTRDLGRDLSSSDSAEYPPSRYEDVKGVTTTMTMAAYAGPNDGSMPAVSFPITPTPGADRGRFKKNIKAKGNTGKLVISKPVILEQEGMNNPLQRIPTVDLATAANYERERRIKLAQRGSTLIAQRPAPQPPTSEGQNGILSREISTKRKQVAPATLAQLERSVSTKTTKTTAGLSVEANASSTSAELSPGTEKVRRRSPRQPPPPPIPSTFQPIRPGEPIRIPIPRPRTPPESPKSEPVKTPLQRRPTTGLPSNPRAQAMKAAKEAENLRQETVMFVNNIVYDDPNAVDNIMQGASKTPMAPLNSRDSVVNRPRPIPRKGDRQVFPAEPSPPRRPKSSGSIASRKSILQSMPGSPTQLPPLPPPPKSAGNVSRPLPNDTKSMTFDEKMSFLYTTPLSAPSSANGADMRRSEVPQIPPLPAAYLADTQPPRTESIREPDSNSERRVSKTTDRSSIRTTSILGIEDIPQRLMPSADRSRNAIDEVGQSWLPGISVENERQKRPSDERSNRKSSPVLPVASRFSMSSMKTESRVRDDDRSTIWGSVHSPVAAVDIQQARRLNARSTYIQNSQSSRISEEPEERSSYANIPSEVMEVMLDTSDSPVDRQESPEKTVQEIPTFHHRIGEECPTFSTRKDKIRSRKMPPPTPLILNRKGSKRAIIIQPAEPSPLESPEAAYQMIQAQLQKFEEPNRDSTGSQGGRLALLENLEREMGQLENKWQNRVDRDSMSSIGTTTSKGSRPPSIAERRASRRASLRNTASRSKSQESTATPSSQSSGTSSENTQASAWQARLAEAQMEYMKSTPDLLMKRNNLNFLSVSKAALGSPSPPDTDESDYENEAPGSVQQLQPTVFKPVTKVHELWKLQSPVQYPVSSGLWVGVAKKSQRGNALNELPGLSVRPAIRKASGSLLIESSQLWEKPARNSSTSAMEGLWKKYDPSGSSGAAARRVTIRPPRRNKRATLLPDILENPEPLPDKRGTLGLFQFPWGEKSENASVQPRPTRMFMAMPGTMTTGGPKINAALEARSKQLEAEEFTTSFFDDYEAEEEGDNFDFSDSDNEGDDFDESTLWEIASLLKSDRVPSKNSLLPLPLQSPSYANSPVSSTNVAENAAEEYRDDGLVLEEPIPAERLPRTTSESTSVKALLWTQRGALQVNTVGLPQPDSTIWKSYIAKPAKMARSKFQSEDAPTIESTELWAPKFKNGNMKSTGLLWSASKPAHKVTVVAPKMKAVASNKSLWVRPIATLSSDIRGLFNPSHSRADYRRTSKVPAALVTERKPRAVEVHLEKLTSRTLWTGKAATKSSLMWEKPSVIYDTERDGLFDSNEARPDFRRTAKEPAAISTKRVTRTVEKPLARLNTNNLWSREITTSSQPAKGAQLFVSKKSMMVAQSSETGAIIKVQSMPLWRKPESSPESEYEGLFDASALRNNYRKTSKAPAAILMSKKPRTIKEPLPVLTTTTLWSENSSEPAPALASAASTLEVIEAREVPTSTATILMWEKSILPTSSSDFEGLFNANVVRVDYRRTSKLPAAINMTRKPRMTEAPLPTLTSTKLWEKSSESSHTPTGASLWSNPTPTIPGLFKVDPSRKDYRTTSTEPAALDIVRKPRAVNDAPLPSLESNRLWTPNRTTSVEVDWISISSVGPQSPSVASVSESSSAPSSPMSDSSSAKTSTTKASSAKSFFSGLFGRKKKDSESSKAPKDSPKAESEVPAVPELPEEFIVKNLDETLHKKPANVPLRKSYRQSVAYRADWDGELREAIAASYPNTMIALRSSYPQDWEEALDEAIRASRVQFKLDRKPASPRAWSVALQKAIVASYPEIRFSRGQALPSQWTAELQDAISKSYPSQADNFDVTVRHPVFMGSMDTTAETIHPAIGPKVLRSRGNSRSKVAQPTSANLDVAVRHPVFFGSMETTAQSVHPAVPVKMQKQNMTSDAVTVPQLWVKSVETEVATESHLFSPNGAVPKLQEASFKAEVDMPHQTVRRPKHTAQNSEPEVGFSEQGLWSRSRATDENSQSQDRDWLDDSMKKRFSRVELRY
ncbi:uncharacterized protein GGS22DRAFT_97770 [Annulohypoxylon maeteangense]|uniref:uncharacterized protein n=1 Tax=Annulohypoxylon maeteangense TaxID=1927788 RepID=UPI0020076919|nr:uncharacterized protein GGS22DRAFT_97770 [Annulohypoxylon maeteangense]KAI0888474.1 hypothetical protein GGS22DRAFT_97770 [Annulohypoxylon maeteangense]